MIDGREGLVLDGFANNDLTALQSRKIERVERLSAFQHHVVRHVDHIADDGDAQGRQTLRQPIRTGTDLDAPDQAGARSATSGHRDTSGPTSNTAPLVLTFVAEREGYHQLTARLAQGHEPPTRAYIKVEYEAPAESEKF